MDPRLFLEGTFVVVYIFMGIGFRHKSIFVHLIGSGALSFLSGYIGMMGLQGRIFFTNHIN
jgi:hypothetical protein